MLPVSAIIGFGRHGRGLVPLFVYPFPGLRMNTTRLLNALTIRDIRWLSSNAVLNTLGMSMELLVQGWLVLSITDSALWVGVASGARGVGHIGAGIFGGLLADRWRRSRVLGTAQLAKALSLFTIGTLILTGHIQLWHAIGVAFLQGMGDAVIAPAFNGLIYDAAGPRRLLNAIAVTILVFHVSWMAGSVIAGSMINFAGIALVCFLAAAVTLLAPLGLTRMRSSQSARLRDEPVWRNLIHGLEYAAGNKYVRVLLVLSVLVETFGFSYITMLPVVAKNVLEVGPTGLGYLSAAGSFGALAGALLVGSLGDSRRKWTFLTGAAGAAGLGLVLFALSPWFGASLLLAGAIGLSLAVYDATINALLQLFSTDAVRGRVLGLYGMTWGFTPLGGFLAGAIASVFSAPLAIGAGGAVIVSYAASILARMREEAETDGAAGPRPARLSEGSGDGGA